jgi:hypothetical protein
MKRIMAIVMAIALALLAAPAGANPERGNSGDRGNPDERGRPTVRVLTSEITEPTRAVINRDRQGRLSLSVVGLEATGTSDCPRGRCQAVDGHSTEVIFDEVNLDLRAVSRGDDGYRYEAQGRVSGIIIWTNDGDVLRSRWHGTFSSFVVVDGEVFDPQRDDLSGEFYGTTILGIAIDHVGAGLTMEDFGFPVIIDHIDAG